MLLTPCEPSARAVVLGTDGPVLWILETPGRSQVAKVTLSCGESQTDFLPNGRGSETIHPVHGPAEMRQIREVGRVRRPVHDAPAKPISSAR